MVSSSLLGGPRLKLADEPQLPSIWSAMRSDRNSLAQQAAVHDILKATLAGGALGAGALGVQRLIQMARPPMKSPLSSRTTVPLMIPVAPGDPEKRSSPENPSFFEAPLQYVSDTLQGGKAQVKEEVPWGKALLALGGLGGGAIGYHAMKPVFDDLQKRRREESTAKAKAEFQDAMMSLYDKPLADRSESVPNPRVPRLKAAMAQALASRPVDNPDGDAEVACVAKMSKLLDEVYDTAFAPAANGVKKAMGQTAGELLNWLGGAGGAAVGVGGVAGVLAANHLSSWKEVSRAVDAANRERLLKRPPQIYVLPQRVPRISKPSFKDEMRTLKQPANDDET